MEIVAVKDNVRSFLTDDKIMMYRHDLTVKGCPDSDVLQTWTDEEQFHLEVGSHITGKVSRTSGGYKISNLKTMDEEIEFMRMSALSGATQALQGRTNQDKELIADRLFEWITQKENTSCAQASVKYACEQYKNAGYIEDTKLMEVCEGNYEWLIKLSN